MGLSSEVLEVLVGDALVIYVRVGVEMATNSLDT